MDVKCTNNVLTHAVTKPCCLDSRHKTVHTLGSAQLQSRFLTALQLTPNLANLSDINTDWRYIRKKRMGSWSERIYANQKSGNHNWVTAVDVFRRMGISILEHAKWFMFSHPKSTRKHPYKKKTQVNSCNLECLIFNDMPHEPDCKGRDISNQHAQSVCWSVKTTPRYKQTRFTFAITRKPELLQHDYLFQDAELMAKKFGRNIHQEMVNNKWNTKDEKLKPNVCMQTSST